MADADFILLERYQRQRDQEAFAELVRRYAPMVYSAGLRVLGDKAQAEDVTQETFFVLLRKPEAATQSLGGWLHRVATQRAIDILRSDTARKLREKLHGVETPAPRQIDSWSELSPMIDEALSRLDEAERDLLVRHFLQGVSQAELAEQLQVSPATISRRTKAAIQSLRRQLGTLGVTATFGAIIALLPQSQASAIPITLTAELGKMSLMSGSGMMAGTATASGGTSATLGASAGWLLLMRVMLFFAAAAGIAGLIWIIADRAGTRIPFEAIP